MDNKIYRCSDCVFISSRVIDFQKSLVKEGMEKYSLQNVETFLDSSN